MTPPGGSTVAVTGASGFLGSHIVDALLDAGWAVRAACRPTSDRSFLDGRSVDWRETDLLDAGSCRAFLDGTAGVIHCAGVVSGTDAAGFRRGNVQTTETLLAAARETLADDAPFLLISSLAAHGPSAADAPARETDDDEPITDYGRSKLAAERALLEQEAPLRRVVLRPPALFGPRDRGFLPLVRIARRGWMPWFGSLRALSLVDGRDAAEAALALWRTPGAEGVHFVGDDRGGYDRRSMAAALADATGRHVRDLHVPAGLLRVAQKLTAGWRPGGSSVLTDDRIRDVEVAGWVCDDARLRKATGFTARRTAAAGFADALAFYRERDWL